jgi:hypothetical protein
MKYPNSYVVFDFETSDDNFNDGINLNSFNYVADGNYKARHQR